MTPGSGPVAAESAPRWERRFALLALAGGVFLVVIGLALLASEQRMSQGIGYALIAGVALVISSAILDPGATVALVRSRQLRFGSLSLVVTAAVLAILVAANLLAARGYQGWDLTSAQLFTLSPKSIAVTRKLDSDLVVTGFFRPSESSDKDRVSRLLARYQAASAHVKVTFEDPDTHLADAKRLNIQIAGSVGLEYKGKPPVVLTLASQQEQDFTSAILKLESNTTPVICWAAGEGERDLTNGTDPFGYGHVATQLQSNNYKTEDVVLSKLTSLPAECKVLAIVGLQAPLSDSAIKVAQDYLAAGGKLILALDPWQDQKVVESANRLLSVAGASFEGGLVIEPDPSHSNYQDPTTPIVFDYGPSPITKDLAKRLTYFPQATPIKFGTSDRFTGLAVAQTTKDAYEVVQPRQDIGNRTAADKAGPFTLMETLDGNGSGDQPRIVLFGTSAVAENRALPPLENSGGVNLPVFLGSFDWLTHQEDLIALPAKPAQAVPLALTQQDLAVNTFITAFAMPGLIVLLGIAVWWRRRAALI